MKRETDKETPRAIRFPRVFRPAHQPFEIECPSGWGLDEVPDYVAVLFDPASGPSFRSNVTIGVDVIAKGVALDDIAQASLADAERTFPEFRLERELPSSASQSTDFSGRLQSFAIPEIGDRGFQMQGLFLAPSNSSGEIELFQMHATCLEGHRDRYEPVFLSVLSSFRFIS